MARQCDEVTGHSAQRLAALFDAHHDRLYRLARRLVADTNDALDLVQETFLRAARALESVPAGDASSEEAWLVRVLVNIQRDHWRKDKVRDRHGPRTNPGIEAGQPQNPEASLIARTTVWQALDRLPPRRRTILVLYELEGKPIPQIARLLKISAITVRWHLSAARRDLARILNSYSGGFHETH